MSTSERQQIIKGRHLQRLPPWLQGLAAGLLIATAFSAIVGVVFWRAQEAMIGEIHSGLTRTARIAARGIDLSVHSHFTSPDQHLQPAYQAAIEPLRAALAADSEIAYAWTLIERDNRLFFVLDGSAPRPGDTKFDPNWVQIMQEFEDPPADIWTAMREGHGIVSQPYTDGWGSFISAFEPLVNAEGKAVGVLGIDLRLNKYHARLRPVRDGSLLALGLGLSIAVLTGFAVWYSRKTDRTARELARQLSIVNALLDVSRALSAGVRLDELLPVIVAKTTALMGAERGALYLFNPANGELRSSYAEGSTEGEAIVLEPGRGIAHRALASGRLQNVSDCQKDADFEGVHSGGVVARNQLALPVTRGDGQSIGVLEVTNKLGEDGFDRDDEVLLQALGGIVLMAFDRARLTEVYVEKQKLDEALKLAASIQMSMVPSHFPPAGSGPVELHAALIPAKEVGGDFYDFFWLGEDRLALVMADVSGKGMPAALFMAKAKTLVKAAALLIDAPEEVLRRANDELSVDNDAGMFVTLFLGILDLRSGRLTYSNAGHNHPMHVHAQGLTVVSGAEGVALGVMEGLDYSVDQLQLAPGDVLALYTDGVNEAMNAAGIPWGNADMEAVVAAAQGDMASRNQALLDALARYVGEAEQSDDITLLQVRWQPG